MRGSSAKQKGSVLIVVLILMMVSMALALFTVSVSRDLVKTSGQILDNLQARLESGSALEKVKYIGSTGRFSAWSVQNVSGLKDFPVQLNLRSTPIRVGGSEVLLQDTAGKLGIWPPPADLLQKVLQSGGMKPPEVAVACDSLADWVDQDDLKRLNGAERFYYGTEQQAAYQPRNDAFMQTVEELELVKGFRGSAYTLVKEELVPTSVGNFNLNTADAALLSAVLRLPPESARNLVQVREKNGMLSLADIRAAGGIGLTFADEYFTNYPSMKVAVEIRTRINDAADSLHAIISFKPGQESPFTVEKFDE